MKSFSLSYLHRSLNRAREQAGCNTFARSPLAHARGSALPAMLVPAMLVPAMLVPAMLVLGVLLLCTPSWAWWPQGHGILSEAATRALPGEVPKFFRQNTKAIAFHSFDPDIAKNRAAPHATAAEAPEHFIDWELIAPLLKENALPATRYEFLKLCYQNSLEPNRVGLVPYAVAEWTERLTVAFAQHRRWPQNKNIQNQCVLTAGILAHYTEDLCQPLHVTVDHDGRANADGTSPKTGIHARMDSLLETLKLSPKLLSQNQNIAPLEKLLPEIESEIQNSRAQIPLVYSLENQLPQTTESNAHFSLPPTPGVLRLANERAREATRFTASLFLTAWRDSARVELPAWLHR
jgi:hypothetical protein